MTNSHSACGFYFYAALALVGRAVLESEPANVPACNNPFWVSLEEAQKNYDWLQWFGSIKFDPYHGLR